MYPNHAFIDLHCDSILKCDTFYSKKYHFTPVNLRQNNEQVDFLRMKQANCLAQFFALFLSRSIMEENQLTPKEEFARLHRQLLSQIEANNDLIKIANNYQDFQDNFKNNKISAFLAIENGEFVTSADCIKHYRQSGITYITLLWNHDNILGHSAAKIQGNNPLNGLTPLGKEVVEAMNEAKMLIDISHASNQTALDVLAITKTPIIASHTASFTIRPHSRNLHDSLLKNLGNNGSVIGMVFFEEFLSTKENSANSFSIIKKHLDHIINVSGIESIALGSDFDGYDHNPQSQVKTVSDLPLLYEYLAQNGYTQTMLEKIYHQNALRIIKEVL